MGVLVVPCSSGQWLIGFCIVQQASVTLVYGFVGACLVQQGSVAFVGGCVGCVLFNGIPLHWCGVWRCPVDSTVLHSKVVVLDVPCSKGQWCIDSWVCWCVFCSTRECCIDGMRDHLVVGRVQVNRTLLHLQVAVLVFVSCKRTVFHIQVGVLVRASFNTTMLH